MKKIFKSIIVISVILFYSLILTGCDSTNNEKSLEKKVNTEILFLDNELISIANSLNNIDYSKYKVNVQEIKKDDSEKKQSETQSSDSEKKSEESGQGEQGEKSDEKEQGKEEGKNSEENENKDASKSEKFFSMKSNNVFEREQIINWKELKDKIEVLYTSWTTISIDLKEIGISSDLLNDFNKSIDEIAIAIKDEDKNRALESAVKLYGYLPEIIDSLNQKCLKNVLSTKYSLLICYKYADIEDWDSFDDSINGLKMSFSNVLNMKNEFKGKEVNIESASVIINEIGNSSVNHDRDVFFIKYRNLMQELNSVMPM